MKSKILSRVVVIALSMFMILGLLAGCGSSTDTESKGSILWMSNISSGIGYDADKAYLEAICEEAGYELIIVYGDMFNDPQGNLSQVMAGMTTDVKGIILSQDGGISNIMAEYPDLYVVGYNTDIRSIFEADGADASLLENDKFLGDIVDGFADGALLGEARAEFVIEQGYTKVATVMFPGFAYPNLPEADAAFRAAIAEYNETADTPIEILGEEAATLMFEPLQESYFLEDGYSDLDAIVAFCAGLEFIYPTMKTAMANGTCSADTKLITGGLDNDETMMADVGEDGVIAQIATSPAENIGYSAIILIKGIEGTLYSDFAVERFDSSEFVLETQEDAQNVLSKSLTGNGDIAFSQITVDELFAVESFADLKALFHSEQISTAALK